MKLIHKEPENTLYLVNSEVKYTYQLFGWDDEVQVLAWHVRYIKIGSQPHIFLHCPVHWAMWILAFPQTHLCFSILTFCLCLFSTENTISCSTLSIKILSFKVPVQTPLPSLRLHHHNSLLWCSSWDFLWLSSLIYSMLFKRFYCLTLLLNSVFFEGRYNMQYVLNKP